MTHSQKKICDLDKLTQEKNDMFFSFVNSLNFIKVYYALKIKINTRNTKWNNVYVF